MKMNFEYFQIKKWMLQTVRSEKVDKENGVISLISMFSSWVMVFKLSKKLHYLQFCADLSKKSKSVEKQNSLTSIISLWHWYLQKSKS